jgi:hypothetical protein
MILCTIQKNEKEFKRNHTKPPKKQKKAYAKWSSSNTKKRVKPGVLVFPQLNMMKTRKWLCEYPLKIILERAL